MFIFVISATHYGQNHKMLPQNDEAVSQWKMIQYANIFFLFLGNTYYGLQILICYIHFRSSWYYHIYFIKPWVFFKRKFYWKTDSNTKATVFELDFHWFRRQKCLMHFWSKFGNFDHSCLPLLNPLLAAFMANNLPWECDLHLSIFMNHFLICIYNCSSHMLAIICQWPKFVC